MKNGRRTRILIVDDSAIVRKVLCDVLSAERDLEVVGTAPDPFIARDKILALQPDVLTLDVEMPRMDGLTFLRKLMHYHPMPVIVISSLGHSSCQVALDALRLAAVEVLLKPGGPYSVGDLRCELANKIRAAAAASLSNDVAAEPKPAAALQPMKPSQTSAVIAIGASTGGTKAIETILGAMPANSPGMVIVQHIPPVFSSAFAERLNQGSEMQVKEAADGDVLEPGRVLIAPGNLHMMLRKTAGVYKVEVKDGPRVAYHRPSVDNLFCSVAEAAGAEAVGIILTGMGSDGAQGMLRMKRAGARTIAQDETSCVVFGMPREAILLNAVDQVVPLSRIPDAIRAEVTS